MEIYLDPPLGNDFLIHFLGKYFIIHSLGKDILIDPLGKDFLIHSQGKDFLIHSLGKDFLIHSLERYPDWPLRKKIPGPLPRERFPDLGKDWWWEIMGNPSPPPPPLIFPNASLVLPEHSYNVMVFQCCWSCWRHMARQYNFFYHIFFYCTSIKYQKSIPPKFLSHPVRHVFVPAKNRLVQRGFGWYGQRPS